MKTSILKNKLKDCKYFIKTFQYDFQKIVKK
jgi:hypothetical protein